MAACQNLAGSPSGAKIVIFMHLLMGQFGRGPREGPGWVRDGSRRDFARNGPNLSRVKQKVSNCMTGEEPTKKIFAQSLSQIIRFYINLRTRVQPD